MCFLPLKSSHYPSRYPNFLASTRPVPSRSQKPLPVRPWWWWWWCPLLEQAAQLVLERRRGRDCLRRPACWHRQSGQVEHDRGAREGGAGPWPRGDHGAQPGPVLQVSHLVWSGQWSRFLAPRYIPEAKAKTAAATFDLRQGTPITGH